MFVQRLIMLAPMFALLIAATVVDLRSRRIPNWLTFSLMGSGVLSSCLGYSIVTPTHAILGLLTGLILNIALFALQIRGGGDVKLFAGLGAWVGPMMTFEVFVIATIVAMIAVLLQSAASGKLTPLLRNTATLAVGLAHQRELGMDHITRPDGSFRSVGKPIPYAVPVIIATLIVLARG